MVYKTKKILFVSEYLDPPYDEGIKKTVFQLYQILDQRFDISVICRKGPGAKGNIDAFNCNRLFLSRKVKKRIKSFSPDLTIYFPFASSTFAAFLRHFILSHYHATANNLMIALQPKPLRKWQEKIVKIFFRPAIVLTPSPLLKQRLENISINTVLIPLLTDLSFFKPVDTRERKKQLRKKYGIPLDSYVIIHVGHLNQGRNLSGLIPLQSDSVQVVIVGSSSTPEDARGPGTLKKELEDHGIIVIDRYIQSIDEIYQLSDLYVFPVKDQNSSIGLPLSILEARACGRPVLTTDYGSVKEFLGDDYGGIYYSEPENFADAIKSIQRNNSKNETKTNVYRLNHMFYEIIQQAIG